MKKFGIKLDGCEEKIEEVLHKLSENKDEYTFLEIGTAEGITTKAVSEIIKDSSKSWKVISLDLVNGWSHNMPILFEIGDDLIYKNESKDNIESIEGVLNKTNVFFLEDPRSYIRKLPDEYLNFVFIDGCHGCPCVIEDFEAIENKVKKGGFVMFHDAGDAEQGCDLQPHCNEFISVKNALQKLGLLDNKRGNWIFAGYILSNENGNDCAVFQKGFE